MREAAALARQYKVQLHTHLAETFDEDDFCKQMFGVLPVDYAEQVNWLGDDVWYAHSVHVRPQDIDLMARTQTGAAHCPTSNMRLASGIAPIRAMMASMGKAGQLPLSGWLPRAMEGPTPSSAVFYGALSVHLGPYLLLRAHPIIQSSPWVASAVAVVGGLTALTRPSSDAPRPTSRLLWPTRR